MAKTSKKPAAHQPLVDDSFDDTDETATPAPVASKKPGLDRAGEARVYAGDRVVDHDKFKLKLAKMLKNIAYEGQVPEIQAFGHEHIFHTIDSNGKKQALCSPVGGHVHEITVTQDANGIPHIKVGPPKKYVKAKRRGRWVRELAPVVVDSDDVENGVDNHTHEVEYLGSKKIALRTTNMEAAKWETQLAAKQAPVIDNVRAG